MSAFAVSTDERLVAAAALEAAEEQLQTLTASHAGTFVSVERRSVVFQGHLQHLLSELDALSKHAAASQHILEQQQDGKDDISLAELAERHRIRRRTLLQHSSLLELLELPNIMDACVRSNLYEEALQIAAFANTLARRHGTDKEDAATVHDGDGGISAATKHADSTNTKSANTVVHQVIAQIRSRQSDLRRHLLGRLRATVTMPECLEVVTAVRRLNAIDLENQKTSSSNLEAAHAATEYQLQISFLEARDVWLDSKMAPVNTYNTNRPSLQLPQDETLLDAIERYRTRMFEVATQFNAIFRAHQHHQAASKQLLAMWTTRRIQSFLRLLQTDLVAQRDAAAIRDAVEASVFFGTSMGRFGADFTCQLAAIFDPALLQTVTQYWKDGVMQLRETLTVCREAGVAGPLATEVGTASSLDDEVTNSAVALEGPQPAPKVLLSLPPLARLVNAILTGLNELRRCLLPGIFPALRRLLEEQLQTVSAELLANERAVLTPGLRGEAAALRAVAAELQFIFRDIVEPYLRGSLEAAIGNVAAAVQQHQLLRDNLAQRQNTDATSNNNEDVGEQADNDTEAQASDEDTKQVREKENVADKQGENLGQDKEQDNEKEVVDTTHEVDAAVEIVTKASMAGTAEIEPDS